jgi:RteC protein
MIDFAQNLYQSLLGRLEAFDLDEENKNGAPDPRVQMISDAIDQLKKKLQAHSFETEEEEISFFKSLLPLFLSLYIYYSEKSAIRCSEQVGTEKSKLEFLDDVFQKIDFFFKVNAEFFNYFRFGRTLFDKYYFVRRSSARHDHEDLPLFMTDISFCPIYSWKLATIMAFSRLERELRNQSSGPGAGSITVSGENRMMDNKGVKLEWTDTKTGLIELIYSLQEQGAFNYGKADLKSIIGYFENMFSIELGNTSSSYQKLISRKKGGSHYLIRLQEKFEQRIEKLG